MDSIDYARAILKATDFNGNLPPTRAAMLFPKNPELHKSFQVGKACEEAVRLELTTREHISQVAKELGWAYSPLEDANDWW